MKTSHTFTILFWINKSRITCGQAELFARVTVDGKRTNIGLKRKIKIEQWDNRAKKAIGNSVVAREINNQINSVQAALYSIYQKLKYSEKFITAQLIKSIYNGEDESTKTLQEIITYHNQKIKNTLAAWKGRSK